jgi:hypothetical protein
MEAIMKTPTAVLALLLAVPFQSLQAAYQTMSVTTRQIVFQDGIRHCEITRPSYAFRVEIVSDDESVKPEMLRRHRPFVTAQPDERYAVRLYNPLPIEVAVNLTVDGLNSVTGKPSGITDGTKWIIEPYSFITIRGWQVNGEESRRFFFTPKPKSYAKWSGDRLGKDLSANCGVIGAAYFWSQKELDAYYEAHPQYRYTQPISYRATLGVSGDTLTSGGALPSAAAAYDVNAQKDFFHQPLKAKEIAGTGMGERESHPTQTVEFSYDQGMYRLSQAIVIYYDFAEPPQPNPFPALSFAPEMP